MNQDKLLAALSMDLRRVATSLHVESGNNAITFTNEVRKTVELINLTFDPRINRILRKLNEVLNNSNRSELAEDALMYSTILQNYCVSRLKTD